MQHVMVDIETMGTGPTAAILSIGAVRFEPLSTTPVPAPNAAVVWALEGATYYNRIALASSVRAGLKLDASTILWWLTQDEEARQEVARVGCTLTSVLEQLAAWFPADAQVWGHGATFDPVIVTSAYNAVEAEPPFAFRNVRDTRTLFWLYTEVTGRPPQWPNNPIKHHALWDAWAQAEAVRRCCVELKGGRDGQRDGESPVGQSASGA